MRQVYRGALLAALLVSAGCSNYNTRPKNEGIGQVGRTPRWNPQPDAAFLVGYLNDNARLVQAVTSQDVTLECSQGRQTYAVPNCRLDCQKPRSFRMTGRAIGQPMMDLGSNEQEFWYWISKADPPYVFHCSHEEFARGAVQRMPFPFQPDMILNGLGIAEYDPNKPYQVKINANTIELIETTRSPQGQPVQKVVVFNRTAARGDQPQVLAHILRDAGGQKIAEVTVTHAVRDRATGAELPKRITLNWPAQEIVLKMKLDDIRVVPPDPQLAQTLYSRRNLASQRSFDLARWQLDQPEGQVQQIDTRPR